MLEVKNIAKTFENFQLENVSFSIEKGDYFILLGPSGSGKTLLMEIIAGLSVPDSGEIYLENKNITHTKIQQRQVGVVFQDYAIFPHMTVYDNISFPLKIRKQPRELIREKVTTLAEGLGIKHLLKEKTEILSGGELQRVAFARTLTLSPKILLLDEPLSSLDVQLRKDLRAMLRMLNRKGQTIMHVTHDMEEAVSLANKIAIINQGKIVQKGKPKIVFQNPTSEFVANFTGIKNFFSCKIQNIENSELRIASLSNGTEIFINCTETSGTGNILIRSEDIFLSVEKVDTSAANNFYGIIEDIYPTIHGVEIIVNSNGLLFCAIITRNSSRTMDLHYGKNIWIHFKATAVKFIQL